MPLKTGTVWMVERSDWFGGCESMGDYQTLWLAEVRIKELRRASKACDDPQDKVRFRIIKERWEAQS